MQIDNQIARKNWWLLFKISEGALYGRRGGKGTKWCNQFYSGKNPHKEHRGTPGWYQLYGLHVVNCDIRNEKGVVKFGYVVELQIFFSYIANALQWCWWEKMQTLCNIYFFFTYLWQSSLCALNSISCIFPNVSYTHEQLEVTASLFYPNLSQIYFILSKYEILHNDFYLSLRANK